MKRVLKWIRNGIIALLLLAVVLLLVLQTEWGQTWATARVAGYLSDELGVEVSVGSVNASFFSDAVLGEVYIADQSGDTLAYFQELSVTGFDFSDRKNCISLDEISLENPVFFMERGKDEQGWNLDFLTDYFSSDSADSTSETCVEIGRIEIRGGRFALSDHNNAPTTGPHLDWSHLDLTGIFLEADDFSLQGDSIATQLVHLSASDHSGFVLTEFAGLAQIGPELMVVDAAQIQTAASNLGGRLAFKYKELEDFSEFVTAVRMNCTFDDSHLAGSDLAYFTSELAGLEEHIQFSGTIKGRVNNLKARNLDIRFAEKSHFHGNCDLSGLPEIDNTFIALTIDEVLTTKKELESIPLPPFGSGKYFSTPDNFAQLGAIRFEGHFTGFLNDFAAYGMLNTDIGEVRADIHMEEFAANYHYEGSLQTTAFDLGAFYQNDALGPLTSNLNISGSGLQRADLDASIEGGIAAVELDGYTYSGVDVNGHYRQNFFEGNVGVDDPYLQLDFLGLIDFTQAIPTYEFTADIANVNLPGLGLMDSQEYACLSAVATVDGAGFDLESIQGTYTLEDLTYCALSDECRLDRVEMTSSKGAEGRHISLKSSILDADLVGQIDLDKLPLAAEFIVADLLPSFPTPEGVREPDEDFDLNITVHDFTLVREFFLPDVNVAPGTFIHLDMHEDVHDFTVRIEADSLRFQDYLSLSPSVLMERKGHEVHFDYTTDQLFLGGGAHFDQLRFFGHSETDSVFCDLHWDSEADGHKGDLAGKLIIHDIDYLDFAFDPSHIEVSGQDWLVDPEAFVEWKNGDLHVEHLTVRDGNEYLRIEGDLSHKPQPRLEVEVVGFELENINPFIGQDLALHGTVNGTANLRDPFGEQFVNADLTVVEFRFQEYRIGDLCLESNWDNDTGQFYMNGEIEKDEFKSLVFNGLYNPSLAENSLDLNLHINRFELEFINQFVDEGVSDIEGTATGDIAIKGTPGHPLMTGVMDFDQVTVLVDYLGTTYTFAEKARIYPDMITMDDITVTDQEDNQGTLVGTLMHENFAEWNFDIAMFIEDEPFLCMNTTKEDNDLFYGKAYSQGYFNISGYQDHIILEGELQSGKGTVLALPLEETGEVQFEDFVTFIDPNKATEEEPIDLTGIEMNFGLDITEDAEIMLILDEAVGDIMSGRGKGHLELSIGTLGNFEMNGLIEVMEGNYLFTLKNLINKEFKVRPGGTIAWYGDPLAADLNLQTVYDLEAPLYDLLGDDNPHYKNRTPIDLVMAMRGKMLTPEIHFEIDLPKSDDITRSRVNSILSSEEELNRQAFSLLVLKRFVSPHHGGGNAGNALALNTLEMLSAQMGLWLSDISDNFDIGINYSPGDEISNEEIAIALSTQLFNERLSISGNFGVSHGTAANQNPSNLIGDIKIEYSITEDGKIRLVVYNETNDYAVATTAQSTYTQGVGVLYQEEFDTIDEFYCGFRNLFRKTEDRSPCD